jgi:glycosyltransferase involved in cell wall biosynthesis
VYARPASRYVGHVSVDRTVAAPPPTQLRVLHATPSFAPAYRYGGPVRSVEGLVVELARLGVDVRVLTTDSHGHERLDVTSAWQTWRGVPVRYLRRRAMPDLAPAYVLESFLEARRADVVHILSIFSAPSMVALVAAELAGRAVVLSPRGMLEPAALAIASARSKRAWIAAFGPFLRRTAIFHATSAEEAESIRRVLGDAVQVRVVPNGTDLEPRDTARARKQRAASRMRIGALGRIHPIKGLDRLIEATAILRDRGLDVELALAGPVADANHRASLDQLAATLSLTDRLHFQGEVHGEAKLDFLADCRVLGLSSHSENFGNVVVEALASLTPVVAVHGTPWSELETAGAGRWVAGTPAALADAIEPYLKDPSLAARAGEHGRTLVEARYGWRQVALTMCDVYEEAARIERVR